MRWPGVRGASRDSRASASAAGSRGRRGRRIGSNAPLTAPAAPAQPGPTPTRTAGVGKNKHVSCIICRVQKVSPARPQPLSALSSAVCRPAARGQAWWPVQQPDSAALKPRQSITCLFPAVAESMLRPGTPSALQCSHHTSVFSKSATASAAACRNLARQPLPWQSGPSKAAPSVTGSLSAGSRSTLKTRGGSCLTKGSSPCAECVKKCAFIGPLRATFEVSATASLGQQGKFVLSVADGCDSIRRAASRDVRRLQRSNTASSSDCLAHQPSLKRLQAVLTGQPLLSVQVVK